MQNIWSEDQIGEVFDALGLTGQGINSQTHPAAARPIAPQHPSNTKSIPTTKAPRSTPKGVICLPRLSSRSTPPTTKR
jgi:hypothetical protein